MSMKQTSRQRRARKTRAKIAELGTLRLTVHRTPRHIYAQIIDGKQGKTLVSASTVSKDLREQITGYAGNTSAAAAVGKALADKAKSAGIERVAFDRSGFRFHGRIKALADAARENGLQF